MKQSALTLALVLFAAIPAFANSNIEGTTAASLFDKMKTESGVTLKTQTMRSADLKVMTETATANGVYCVVYYAAGDEATCAFNGQNMKGDPASMIKTLGDAGIFLGKPVQTKDGNSLREISLQTLSCERTITIVSDYGHRIPPQFTYSCTVGR